MGISYWAYLDKKEYGNRFIYQYIPLYTNQHWKFHIATSQGSQPPLPNKTNPNLKSRISYQHKNLTCSINLKRIDVGSGRRVHRFHASVLSQQPSRQDELSKNP